MRGADRRFPDSIANATKDTTLLNAFQIVIVGNNLLQQPEMLAITLIETGGHSTGRGPNEMV